MLSGSAFSELESRCPMEVDIPCLLEACPPDAS
jgi:hypothetical protein